MNNFTDGEYTKRMLSLGKKIVSFFGKHRDRFLKSYDKRQENDGR